MRTLFALAASMVVAGYAQALTFTGPSAFTVVPFTTAPGTSTNNLVLTDTANGFTVSGQFIVNVNSGASTGTLLQYQVQRPIDPLSPSQAENLAVNFSGFIDCPVGGLADQMICSSFNSSAPASTTVVSVAYAGGTVTPFTISTTTAYNHVAGAGWVLEQRLNVGFSYASGSVGQYIVDLPATTESQPVPEPASLTALGLASAALLRRKSRVRR